MDVDVTKKPARLLAQMRAAIVALSHDLSNPLAVISGNAQLLLEMAQSKDFDEEVVESIRDIEKATRHLDKMLGDLDDLKEEVR